MAQLWALRRRIGVMCWQSACHSTNGSAQGTGEQVDHHLGHSGPRGFLCSINEVNVSQLLTTWSCNPLVFFGGFFLAWSGVLAESLCEGSFSRILRRVPLACVCPQTF